MNFLVLGDVMLDRYLHGTASHPNPDGAGTVFHVSKICDVLGGAGGVARMLRQQGHSVRLLGVIGMDEAGERILQLAQNAGITCGLQQVRNQTTTIKQRSLIAGALVAGRVDFEIIAALTASQTTRLIKLAEKPWDGIFVSDYGKGVITDYLLGYLTHISGNTQIFVDPAHGRFWSTYPQEAVIKSNLREARMEAVRVSDESHLAGGVIDRSALVESLAKRHDGGVVVTAGADGIYWACGGFASHCVGEPVTQIVNTVGAGDVVLVALGCHLAKGRDLDAACRVADEAARVYIGRVPA